MSLETDARKSASASARARPEAGRGTAAIMNSEWDSNSMVLEELASHVLFPSDEPRSDDEYEDANRTDVNNGDCFVESSADDNAMMNTPKIEMSDDEDLSPKGDFSAMWGDLGDGEVIEEVVLPVNPIAPSPPQLMLVDYNYFATNPMEVVNVLEVEGRAKPPATWAERKLQAAGVRLDIPMTVVPEQPMIPVKEESEAAAAVVDTPAVEMLLAGGNGSFDLFNFIHQDELPIDDPEFLKHLNVDSLSPTLLLKDPLEQAILQSELTGLGTINIVDIEEEEEKPAADEVIPRVPPRGKRLLAKPAKLKATKLRASARAAAAPYPPRRRGRPPSSTVTSSACSSSAASPRPSTSSDHSYMWRDASSMSEDEVKDFKYRRMRDLNNEASKRCRQNRKKKSDEMEQVEKDLVAHNAFLRAKVNSLESKTRTLTDWIRAKGLISLTKVAAGK
jgi:hypothetical protein